MTIPTLIAPQLRTATGRVNDPARRDRGPPQDAISLKSKLTKPAIRMNAISMTGPVSKPMPPPAILDPNP